MVFDSNKVIEIEEDSQGPQGSQNNQNNQNAQEEELEGMDMFVSAKELFGDSIRVDRPVCSVLPTLFAEIEKYEEDCVDDCLSVYE